MQMSTLVPNAFVWEKLNCWIIQKLLKSIIFKVCIYSKLNELHGNIHIPAVKVIL